MSNQQPVPHSEDNLATRKAIGARITVLREAHGLSQKALSDELAKLGLVVRRETITQWENATRDLKAEYIIHLSSFFDVTSDWLLGILPSATPVPPQRKITDDALGKRFKDARLALPEGQNSTCAVSKATGIQQSLISDLENGKDRNVGYQTIRKLALHYGVTSDWLMGLTDDPQIQPVATDELGLSAKAVNVLRTISPDEVSLVNRMICTHSYFLADRISAVIAEWNIRKRVPVRKKR